MLLDTDVMVDILRQHTSAVYWLESLANESVGLPGLVAMELLQGCRNQAEQQRVERLLRQFVLYWPDRDDCVRALDDFATYHLSHSLGLLDALIAETAVGVDQEFATFNTKHYSVISGLRVIEPYTR
jgi:predicted nucleic acid-binding protein